jgi:hypothetical protein
MPYSPFNEGFADSGKSDDLSESVNQFIFEKKLYQ